MNFEFRNFLGMRAISFRCLGVEASLRVGEVLGSNPRGNIEIRSKFQKSPREIFGSLVFGADLVHS